MILMDGITKKKMNNFNKDNNYFYFKDGTKSDIPKKEELKNRNPFNPFSYFDLFKKYDIPIILEDWILCLLSISRREKADFTLVFGKYLSRMKLKGYRQFTFKDSYLFNTKFLNDKETLKELEIWFNKLLKRIENE